MSRTSSFVALATLAGWASFAARADRLGSDLAALAALHGGPGDERRVIEFIRERVGGTHREGANGSLLAEFGRGDPRILLIAGVDEPGFAVSGIDGEGYLRLQPLSGSRIRGGLASYFRGQHVGVATGTGVLLPGVAAAPSVHFGSAYGAGRRLGENEIFVDIGASSPLEARAAGVSLLDRVTLEKRVARLAGDRLAGPWISSRAGVALLLSLARRLESEPPDGTVTLAFVTQQYPYSAGLRRVLESVPADHAVLLASNGGSADSIAPASGSDPGAIPGYVELAGKVGLRLERRYSHEIAFGPFGGDRPWDSSRRLAVLSPGVRNSSTPAESMSLGRLEGLARLLELVAGLEERDSPSPMASGFAQAGEPSGASPAGSVSSLEETIRALVEVAAVSGSEGRVRERILELVPRELAADQRVDKAGNLIVRVGPPGEPAAAFLAHMDEIGFEVQDILPRGVATAASKGGGNRDLFSWHPAAVHGRYGTLPAVMAQGQLDLGADSDIGVKAMGVREGDTVTVPKRYKRLLGSRVSARSLDDRLGCAALVEALRRLSGRIRRATRAVDFVFSVEEETGLNGARRYAASARPARVYPVDTFVTSDSPFGPSRLARAGLGAGAVLRALDQSGMTPRREVERVIALARRHRIPLQVGVTAGGNDGSVFPSLETANIPIGFPLRYAHTPVETADLRDAEAVAALVEKLALEELRGR